MSLESLGVPSPADAARLYDRRADLDLAKRVARRLRGGLGSVVVWIGEPGIGKTAMLRAATDVVCDVVDDVRATHVSGRAVVGGPLATLRQVLRQLLPLAPQLRSDPRLSAVLAGSGSDDDPRQLLTTAGQVLTAAASRGPLLVTIDDGSLVHDGHWEVIGAAAAQISHLPVVVLVGERPPAGPVGQSFGPLTVRNLAPLSTRGSIAVVGRATNSAVPPWVAAELGHELAGNPAALTDVSGVLTHDEVRGLEPLPRPLPAFPSTIETFGPWLGALGSRERFFVLCAALALRPRITTLEEAAGTEFATVPGPAGRPWAKVTRGEVVFLDPRVRSAAVRTSSIREVEDAQVALSEATGDRAESLWHRAEMGEALDEDALNVLVEAAEDALNAGDIARASMTLRHAVSRGKRGSTYARLTLVAGLAAYHEGQLGRASRLLHDAAAAAPDAATLTAATAGLCFALAGRDGTTPAGLVDATLARLDRSGHRAEAASLACLVSRIAFDGLQAHLARSYLDKAARLAASEDENGPGADRGHSTDRLAIEIDTTAAMLGRTDMARPEDEGPPRHLALVATTWPVTDLVGWEIAARQVQLLMRREAWPEARFALAEFEQRQSSVGSRALAALSTVVGLDIRLAQGAVRETDDVIAAADRLPVQIPFGGAGLCLVPRALVLRDRIADADPWLGLARSLAQSPGRAQVHVQLPAELALVKMVEGNPAEAARFLDVAVERSSHFDQEAFARLHLDLLEARHAAGLDVRTAEVLALLEYAWSGPHATSGERAMLAAARLLAAPAERTVSATLAAIDAGEWQESPLWAGRVRMLAARALGSLSDDEHSVQVRRVSVSGVPSDREAHRQKLVREAYNLFVESGATALARVAAGALESPHAQGPGSRPVGGITTSHAGLTADELRVARLVAGGSSNRQVASTTYVSVRTVELRLTSVYRKLGIRSRKELPDALAAVDGEEHREG